MALIELTLLLKPILIVIYQLVEYIKVDRHWYVHFVANKSEQINIKEQTFMLLWYSTISVINKM